MKKEPVVISFPTGWTEKHLSNAESVLDLIREQNKGKRISVCLSYHKDKTLFTIEVSD
jgi:hypothetical protein